MSVSKMRRAAVHEAGHAVFAVLTTTPFRHVMITPEGGGHLLHADTPESGELRLVVADNLICDAMVALAGEIAEATIVGHRPANGLDKDHEDLHEAVASMALTAARRKQIERRCRSAMQSLCQIPAIRAAVEEVAEALGNRLRLTSEEIERLVSADARREYEAFPNISVEKIESATRAPRPRVRARGRS